MLLDVSGHPGLFEDLAMGATHGLEGDIYIID